MDAVRPIVPVVAEKARGQWTSANHVKVDRGIGCLDLGLIFIPYHFKENFSI